MAVVDSKFETKGTHLFFVNAEDEIVKLTCPTGITGLNGGSKDRIDTTCLDETGGFRTYVGGFAEAAEVSVPFVLYAGDGSQQDLFTLQASGAITSWLVGLSDSDDYPNLSTAGALISPPERTTFSFQGYVSNLTIDVATNEVVRGTLTIQPSGNTTANWAA